MPKPHTEGPIDMIAKSTLRASQACPPALLATAFVLAASAATAQQPGQPMAAPPAAEGAQPPQPQSVFGETIDVRVVNVEVVVTDKDGVRVTGLKPADFKLIVEGKQTPIDYFTEVRGGDAVAATAEGGSVVPGLPALAPGERVGTSYLVFVDDYFSLARDRDSVIEALVDNLSMLGADDRMAVVAFDGKQLAMLSTWSSSQRALERAFKEALRRPALGLQRVAERRNHDRTVSQSPSLQRSAFSQSFRLDVAERQYADQLAGQVERSVGAAAAALRGFAAPPGRKVMLLLSGGWSYSPAAYAVNDPSRPIAGGEVTQGEQLYAPLTDTANLVGYTVYPVDVPGFGDEFEIGAERGGQLQNGLLVEPEARFVDTSLTGSRERERDVQQAFYYVAGQTGGRALLNARCTEAFPEVVADTCSYYWIGFIPARNCDDQRYDIRVETTRSGLKVRSCEGFRDLSRGVETDMAVESALLFGNALTAGALEVFVGPSQPAGRRTVTVPLKIVIPVDALTVVPIDGQFVAKLELRLGALDVEDRKSDIPSVPLEISFKSQPPAGSVIPYETQIKLRKARQTLVVSLNDPLSGHNLTARLEVDP